jgi:uncharacterized DUF497 family protein
MNVDHIARHGVTPDEAEQVVNRPLIVGPNTRHPGRMFAKGVTRAGRKLGVSYVVMPDGRVLVITAFDVR